MRRTDVALEKRRRQFAILQRHNNKRTKSQLK